MKKYFICTVLLTSLLLTGCEKERLIDEFETTTHTETTVPTAETTVPDTYQTTFVGLAESTAVSGGQAENSAEMPEPFAGGFDGFAAEVYRMPFSSRINEIPPELMALRDSGEVGNWLSDSRDIMNLVTDKNAPPVSIKTYANVYTFIHSFDITREEGETVLTAYHQYTGEELDAVFSDSTELVCGAFANDYAIAAGGMLYTPQWVYWHGAEDYKAEGISPETLAEKAPLYAALPFSDGARTAFAEKLSAYAGEDISLTVFEN